MVNYYRILGIRRDASTADIKRAYHKLAFKWHPDKNPDHIEEATRRFKEISEAYQVLSDAKKRRVYDQHAKEDLVNDGPRSRSEVDDDFDTDSGSFSFRDPEEMFREFFDGTPFADFFGDIHSRYRDSRRNRNSHPSDATSSHIFRPFGFSLGDNIMNDFFSTAPGEFASTSNLNETFTNGASGGNAYIKRTSISTRCVNGKKTTTKKVYENGKETVMFYENDVLKSKTVDGVPQSIAHI